MYFLADLRNSININRKIIEFLSIFLAFIIINIWLPVTIEKNINKDTSISITNVESSETVTSTKTIHGTYSTTLYKYTKVTTTSTTTTTASLFTSQPVFQNYILLKANKSISNKQDDIADSIPVYLNDTVYNFKTEKANDLKNSLEMLTNICTDIKNSLNKTAATVSEIIERINSSSVSIELGSDSSDSDSLTEQDLVNLSVNVSQFDNLFNEYDNNEKISHDFDNFVNITKFKTNVVKSPFTNNNLTLNTTQYELLSFLIYNYSYQEVNTKRSTMLFKKRKALTIQNFNKKVKKYVGMTILSILVYCIFLTAIIGYQMFYQHFYPESITTTSKKIVLLEKYCLNNDLDTYYELKNELQSHEKSINKNLNMTNHIKNLAKINFISFFIWSILIFQYIFVQYHYNITFFDVETVAINKKRDLNFDIQNIDLDGLQRQLTENINQYIDYNLFNNDNGLLQEYISSLGIEDSGYKNILISYVKNDLSPLYGINFDKEISVLKLLDSTTNNKRNSFAKRESTETRTFEQLYSVVKSTILLYLTISIVIVSILILIKSLGYIIVVF
ncbi:hypothetical protein HANVADRAFT_47300 [Hanseniaspora valbyensis NRRL Y-1626]|uniref:Uncharacterized protein n=1 Tax=Hanseniaspora valbyensis NRRL Y-1626 TaxID=766949 RepID=A0A1B7TJ11_9ASCO|nr:hypothetical protein HANVADRAFT_47300 [Hanseniaspora valbyensis NRRL Y-1626]